MDDKEQETDKLLCRIIMLHRAFADDEEYFTHHANYDDPDGKVSLMAQSPERAFHAIPQIFWIGLPSSPLASQYNRKQELSLAEGLRSVKSSMVLHQFQAHQSILLIQLKAGL